MSYHSVYIIFTKVRKMVNTTAKKDFGYIKTPDGGSIGQCNHPRR